MSLIITLLTLALAVVSFLLIVVVLMQKAKSDGGVAAMGGGMAESAFGAETGNVLVTATKNLAIIFFVLTFVLYSAHIYRFKHQTAVESKLPTVVAPAVVPAASPAGLPAAQPVTLPPSAPAKP